MTLHVFQRPDWYGEPKALGELFTLRKVNTIATCQLWSHQFGFELRLVMSPQAELLRSQVCRSDEEILTASEQWKAALIEKGWT
jgi:hypothetical protein